MDNHPKLSTEEILEDLAHGNVIDVNAIDFVAETNEHLNTLACDIVKCYDSYSKFAIASDISPSHLNEFLNGKKQLSRDRLICICVNLKYDIKKTRHILRCVGKTDLYCKNRRDFEILNGLQQGKNLDELNEILQKNGLNILPDKKSKESG